MSSVNSVLARKLGRTDQSEQQAPPAQEASSGRLLRVALMRAADRAIGLSLSVLGIAEDAQSAEELIENAPDDWMVLGLCHPGVPGLAGLVLVDGALRTAIIEVQTIGMLMESGEIERPITATDAALSMPVIEGLLEEIAQAGLAVFGPEIGEVNLRAMPNLRAAGLMMRDGRYHSWRMSLQIGGTERQGEIILALAPPPVRQDSSVVGASQSWSQDLRSAVEEATARLDAVLCRLTLPISVVGSFEVGQMLTLAGVTVGSVTLEGPGETPISTARLGQVSGQRAVRLEAPIVELQEAHAPTASSEPASQPPPAEIPPPGPDVAVVAEDDSMGGEGL